MATVHVGQEVWKNPFGVDNSDPLNWENPTNAMYYISEVIHHADVYLGTHKKEDIDINEFLQNIENLNKLKKLALQKISKTNKENLDNMFIDEEKTNSSNITKNI